jgi:hypothetical protein
VFGWPCPYTAVSFHTQQRLRRAQDGPKQQRPKSRAMALLVTLTCCVTDTVPRSSIGSRGASPPSFLVGGLWTADMRSRRCLELASFDMRELTPTVTLAFPEPPRQRAVRPPPRRATTYTGAQACVRLCIPEP